MAERKAEKFKADVLPAATVKALTYDGVRAKTRLQHSQVIFLYDSTEGKSSSFRRAK